MAESKEELKEPLDKGERGEWKSWLKTQHSKKRRLWHLVPSLHGRLMEKMWKTVTDFIFLGSKITVDSDYSHEIKRCLLTGRIAIIKLDRVLKSRDIILLTTVCVDKAMAFPVVMYRCEHWTIRKAKCRRINALELWCWRRLLSPLDSGHQGD